MEGTSTLYNMKACGYCGRSNSDEVNACIECHTSFAEKSSGSFTKVVNWIPQSVLGVSVTTGTAAFFICTGLYCSIGVLAKPLYHILKLGGSEGDPSNSVLSIFMPHGLELSLAIVFIVVTGVICKLRISKSRQAALTAIVTFATIAFLRFLPGPWDFLVPALLFGIVTNSSVGFLVGSALQFFVGVWLLGLFNRKKSQTEALAK